MAIFSSGSSTPDRRRERRFAVLFLLLPALTFAVIEFGAQYARHYLDRDRMNWTAFAQAIAAPSDGPVYLLRPTAEFGNLRTNSLGLRSPEIDMPKPEGTFRIGFLGDSVTLGADLVEEQTYPALVMSELTDRNPYCSFDYATFAGPSYKTDFLVQNFATLQPMIEADLLVVLAGGPTELLSLIEDERGLSAQPRRLFDFASIDIAGRVLNRVGFHNLLPPANRQRGVAPIDIDPALNQIIDNLAQLDALAPVIVVGHRGQVRRAPETGIDAYLRSRMQVLPTVSPGDLTERIFQRIDRKFPFLDPQDDVPADRENYLDALHLTGAGHEALAARLAEDLQNLMTDCRLSPPRRLNE